MATILPRALEPEYIAENKKLKGGPGVVYGAHLAAGSGAAATLIIYDNTTGSGEKELKLAAVAGGADDCFPAGVGFKCNTGIYAVISGAGAEAVILYE